MNVNEVFKKFDPKTQAQWRDWSGMEFLIAPMGHQGQKKEVLKTFTLKEAMELENEGPAAFKDVTADIAIGRIYELYSKVLVLDWRNVTENDKELKFSSKKVLEWMMEHDDFANWVIKESVDVRDSLEKKVEELEKN
jgi:hypothetical protein